MHRKQALLLTLMGAALGLSAPIALSNGVINLARDSVEVTATEGAQVTLNVQRDSTRDPVTVDYEFRALTAQAGSDFPSTGGSVLFKDGVDRAVIEIDLPQDADPEHTETFRLRLNNPTGGATLGTETTALIRIRDNDWADEDTRHHVRTGTYEIPVASDPTTQKLSGPNPIPINVAGLTREVIDVRVKVSDLSHEAGGDLDLILEGPGGHYCKLMSDFGFRERGETEPLDHLNLCFSSAGTGLQPDDRLESGIWSPFDHEEGEDQLRDRTPVPAGTEDLRVFNGLDPNGTWRLHVVDDNQGVDGNPPHFVGEILGGWELILSLEPIVPLPVISEVRNLNVVTVAFFFTGPANETFVWERSTPESGGWEFVRDVTTLGENQLQQLNSSKNGFPTAIYRFRRP